MSLHNSSQLCQVPQKGYKGVSAGVIQHSAGAVMLSWLQGISLTHSQGMVPNSITTAKEWSFHVASLHPRHLQFCWVCSAALCRPQLCTTGKFSKQIRAHKPSVLPFHSTIFCCSVTHSSQMNTLWLLPT